MIFWFTICVLCVNLWLIWRIKITMNRLRIVHARLLACENALARVGWQIVYDERPDGSLVGCEILAEPAARQERMH